MLLQPSFNMSPIASPNQRYSNVTWHWKQSVYSSNLWSDFCILFLMVNSIERTYFIKKKKQYQFYKNNGKRKHTHILNVLIIKR